MTQPAKSQEPSMEEILASIRRIIADDDANKSAQAVEPPPPVPPKAAAPPPAPKPAPPPPRPPAPVARVAPPEPSYVPPEPEPEPEPIAEVDEQTSDILDLTEQMAAPQEADETPQFRTIDGSFDVGYDDAAEPPPEAAAPLGESPPYESTRLMSSTTTAAVDSAFNTLAQTVLVQNARTLEDLVREMLRPMLKSWLDDNLPSMVERLVRNEIERVSRGRMG
jgi:uncharacterized protein